MRKSWSLGGTCGAAISLRSLAAQRRHGRLRHARNNRSQCGALACSPAIAGEDAQTKVRVAAFLQELQKFGWTEGRNLRIDLRGGAGNVAATRKYATELVALAPDVILASGATPVALLLEATHTVPIVFAIVVDPMGAGFVEKLSRPGGNATGFMMFDYSLSGKWVELLKQVAPGVTQAAVLRDTSSSAGVGQFAVIQAVAPSLGLEVSAINVGDAREIDRRGRGIRARAERRSHRDGGSIDSGPSRSDRHPRGSA